MLNAHTAQPHLSKIIQISQFLEIIIAKLIFMTSNLLLLTIYFTNLINFSTSRFNWQYTYQCKNDTWINFLATQLSSKVALDYFKTFCWPDTGYQYCKQFHCTNYFISQVKEIFCVIFKEKMTKWHLSS